MTQSSILNAQRFTPDEAAEKLAVSAATLAHWRCEGRGPAFYKLGRRIWYYEADLQDYLHPLRAILRSAKEEQAGPPGSVYFIQGEGIPLIKIGFADQIDRRLSELQVGSPVPLSVIARFPGTQRSEARLHREFDYCWVRGEWFSLDKTLTEFIELVKATHP